MFTDYQNKAIVPGEAKPDPSSIIRGYDDKGRKFIEYTFRIAPPTFAGMGPRPALPGADYSRLFPADERFHHWEYTTTTVEAITIPNGTRGSIPC